MAEEKEKIKWLTRLEQIETASEDELRRSLLTPDGMGVQFKAACLAELIEKVKDFPANYEP